MADVAITYDLNILLDSELPEEQRERILADVEAMVADTGSIVSAHDWGRRKLAYEIKHKPDADFHLIQFNGPRELLDRLDRTLRITDGVVRYRIIKLRPNTPPPPDLRSVAPVTGGDPEPERDRDRDRGDRDRDRDR